VTGALKPLALPQYSVHQSADGGLRVRYRGSSAEAGKIRAALLDLFGPQQTLSIDSVESFSGPSDKVIQYTSDLIP
jgi:phenylacetate-CoA ligase